MTTQTKRTISPIYGFHITHEADDLTDAQYTLFAHGEQTRVYVQVLGGNKFCVSVDNLDQEPAVIKSVGIADSSAQAMQMAIDEYENPSVVEEPAVETKKPAYTFPQTGEADPDTYAELTLHVDGKPTKVLIMVVEQNEYCVCVDNIGDGVNSHVEHLGIFSTQEEAEKVAISQFEKTI